MKNKYDYGDYVEFTLGGDDEKVYEGCIEIVDRMGTFLNPGKPSYDIYSCLDNIFYKHVGEDLIIRWVREAEDKEKLWYQYSDRLPKN